MISIGVTESGDPAFDDSWVSWTQANNATILITKQLPTIIKSYGYKLLERKIIINVGITGYGGTIFEPGVPKPEEVIDCLKSVPKEYRSKIVIRIDPIIPLEIFINKSLSIMRQIIKIEGYDRYRISILDYYKHSRRKAKEISIDFQNQLDEAYYGTQDFQDWMNGEDSKHLPLNKRLIIKEQFQSILSETLHVDDIEVCGEPGIECTGCVSLKDYERMGILGDQDNSLLFTKGQRLACNCLCTKTELLKKKIRGSICKSGCFYCYWL
jgi:hypothetical protein